MLDPTRDLSGASTPPHPPPAGSPARRPARPLASSLWLRAAPWPSRAPNRRNARTEPASAFLRFFPPSLSRARPLTRRLPRRSRTPLHRKAQPTARSAPSPSDRLTAARRQGGRRGGGAARVKGRSATSPGGGAGESTARTGFPDSPWDT